MSKTIEVPGQLLADAGQAIYGPEWTGPLSRALGHSSPRTCQRWMAAARAGETYRVSRSLVHEVQELFRKEAVRMEREARAVKFLAVKLERLLIDDAKAGP